MKLKEKTTKILQISNYYAPENGGIEKIATAISDGLSDNYEMRVICFTRKGKSSVEYINNVRVIRSGEKLHLNSQQLSFDIVNIIKRELKNYEPDIIVLHAPNPYLEKITLRYINKDCKLIVYWHSDIVKQKIGKLIFHQLTVALLSRADRIIATSPNYIDGSEYLSIYRDKCRVIPNCIDDEVIKKNEKVKKLEKEIKETNASKCICVAVGRQVPYKGFEYLCKVFAQLSDMYQLYIIGKKDSSSDAISRLSMNHSNIHILGEVDYDTLRAYLGAMDIFCFSSITKNEAFGIALAEAMAFGKPSVTFKIQGSGVNYVSIDGITGIECENKNIVEYKNAIEKLASDDKLRIEYGNNARLRVNKLFTYEIFKKNINHCIEDLIN